VPDAELDVLAVSAQARLLLRALLAQWRAVEDPGRRDYLLSHSATDWAYLARAQEEPAELVSERFRALAARANAESQVSTDVQVSTEGKS
jgi:hypothetical protein